MFMPACCCARCAKASYGGSASSGVGGVNCRLGNSITIRTFAGANVTAKMEAQVLKVHLLSLR
jgi:hypothetical protein